MSNKQQTAVEWLVAHLTEYGFDLQLHKTEIGQAKEIEKQRMIDAHINGQAEFDKGARRIKNDELAQMWYNETYGGNK
jgi:hypothetical protein